MKNRNAQYFIKHLHLQPHPEDGWYRETYRAAETIPADALPERLTAATGIFSPLFITCWNREIFLLFIASEAMSAGNWYAGGTLHIHIIEPDRNYHCISLGSDIEKGE